MLRKEDFERLVDAPANLMHRVLLSLLFATGMRTTELVTIKTSDVDLDNRTISIIDSKKYKRFTIPICSKTCDLLAKYLVTIGNGWLFPSRWRPNNHITARGAQWIVKIYAARLNLKNWFAYNPRLFRCRLARLWVIKKGNLLALQDVLRHQRFSSTTQYIDKIRFESETAEVRKEYDRIMS